MRPPSPAPAPAAPFAFRDPGPLADGELSLVLDYRSPSDPARGWIPAYHFRLRVAGCSVGGIALRVDGGAALGPLPGHPGRLGHLSYFVAPAWRGRGYAAHAARLLLPLARAHGLDPLWVTCDPDNAASRRTCERLGAVLVAVVAPPDPPDARAAGARAGRPTCHYRVDVARLTADADERSSATPT